MRLHRAPLTAWLIVTLCQSAFSQLPNSERDHGIALYEQGKYQAAADAVRSVVNERKDDLTAWHYLGLALESVQRSGAARTAHEKAVKLGDALIAQKFSKHQSGDFVGLFGPLVPQLRQAELSVHHYMRLTRLSNADAEVLRVLAERLRDFADLSDSNSTDQDLRLVYSGKDVTTKARVLEKPEPQYTREARLEHITGTVVLSAILSEDGKVRAIVPVKSLPDGLTENCIRVAKQMKFVPAFKDGRPVSMSLQLEYNFNLY